MKKSFLTFAAIALIFGFTSCKETTEPTEVDVEVIETETPVEVIETPEVEEVDTTTEVDAVEVQ